MAIYATRWFYRWARKQKLDAVSLQEAVHEMTAGLFDADLGGHVIKKRVARAGQGKSGGFRTLVATNQGDRWIFMYGFAKNERSNIDKDGLEAIGARTAGPGTQRPPHGRAGRRTPRGEWR